MRGQRPFAPNIAPELDELIEQACAMCESQTTPGRDAVDRLRLLGKAWNAAGCPLVQPAAEAQ